MDFKEAKAEAERRGTEQVRKSRKKLRLIFRVLTVVLILIAVAVMYGR